MLSASLNKTFPSFPYSNFISVVQNVDGHPPCGRDAGQQEDPGDDGSTNGYQHLSQEENGQ